MLTTSAYKAFFRAWDASAAQSKSSRPGNSNFPHQFRTRKELDMFAVMGITGQVGSAVADTLFASGQQVRAVLRNPEKAATWKARGAEIAVADYDDPAALRAAFTGTEGVFAMLPPNFAPSPDFAESRKTIASIHQALAATLPPKVVYLSSIGAEKSTGTGLITGLHLLEEQLKSLPIPSAFLRAAWFMENFVWDVGSAREGRLFTFF